MKEKEFLVHIETIEAHRVGHSFRVSANNKEEALKKVEQNLFCDTDDVECIHSEFIDYVGAQDEVIYPDVDDIKEL